MPGIGGTEASPNNRNATRTMAIAASSARHMAIQFVGSQAPGILIAYRPFGSLVVLKPDPESVIRARWRRVDSGAVRWSKVD